MNKRVTHKIRIVVQVLSMILCVVSMTGCEGFNSGIQDMNGSITGNEYYASFYTNDGQNFMNMHGEKIDLSANTVYEYNYSSGSNERTLSSVVTITIDGQEVENCGSTVIFAEKGLDPDVNFQVQDIESSANGFGDNTIIANTVNAYKNMFGKSRVVVIQSQLGDPICAYSGDSVYYEVCSDLPKTTKLSIDGKALYIHRANFQIIDTSLLD